MTDNKQLCVECGENQAEVTIKDKSSNSTEDVCRQCAIRALKCSHYELADIGEKLVIDVVEALQTPQSQIVFFSDYLSRGATCLF